MSSGESEYNIRVNPPPIDVTSFNEINGLLTGGNSLDINTPFNYRYYSNSWPTTIYMYQIRCPKRACKTNNWLQLDTITPCTKCGSRLKAVSEQADFEVPIK